MRNRVQTDYRETRKESRSLGVWPFFPSSTKTLNHVSDGMYYWSSVFPWLSFRQILKKIWGLSPGHTNFWFCSCSCPVRLRNLDQFQPSFRVVEIIIIKFSLLCHMMVPLMKCMNLCPTLCHTEIIEVNKNCYTFFLFLSLLNLVTVNFEYGSAYVTFISILDPNTASAERVPAASRCSPNWCANLQQRP